MILQNSGGAFCYLCSCSKEQCSNVDCISSEFKNNHSLEQTLSISVQDLHLQENCKTGGYDLLKGVTQEPITSEDILFTIHFDVLVGSSRFVTMQHLSWLTVKLVPNHIASKQRRRFKPK